MKRWIHCNTKADNKIYRLKVIVDVSDLRDGDENTKLIASAILKDPQLKQSKKLSKDQFERLDSVIVKILELVNYYKFHISDRHQSPRSYSYYIRFTPVDELGNTWQYDAEIQLEVRDHPRNDGNKSGWVSDSLYIQAFHVGNKTCFDTTTTISEVRKTLHKLSKGDYSDLEEVTVESDK